MNVLIVKPEMKIKSLLRCSGQVVLATSRHQQLVADVDFRDSTGSDQPKP